MVCFIHRPEYYKITEDEKGASLLGVAEIIIAKHRNGATGDVRLRFKNEYAKFMNMDDEPYFKEFSSSINSGGSASNNGNPAPIGSNEDFLRNSPSPEVPF